MVSVLAMSYNIDIFFRFMISPQNVNPPKQKLPKSGLLFYSSVAVLFLFLLFFAILALFWLKAPVDGVKLHGTVDIGIDLLGAKNDLIWFGVFGVLVFLVNMSLAFAMAKREFIASIYLIVATGLIFLLLIGTIFFLLKLNRLF